ncbi:MAG TPA: PKD domain-containing protein, partial [Candidatus Saccharimonadia bacterium]|nr:PKD domain-containing protein [Candidatus Saccharimonadia bacterium]
EPGQGVCATGAETRWQPHYGTISGTSMATPHVAGALALLYQAEPLLTPADAEELIQDTARKVKLNASYIEDPQNPGSTIHFGYGAGLLDVIAALDALGTPNAGQGAAGTEVTIFDGDADSGVAGAADVVKLTAQEYTEGPGVAGVAYRLTLRNATAFGSAASFTYRVAHNPNGRHYETSVVATSTTVTIPAPGPGNTAPASSVTRNGNVVTIRVPYSRLGYPPAGAPVHNVAATSADANGFVDFAPSPAGSTGTDTDLKPMYGRPFTVALAIPSPADGETVCTMPGKTQITDDPGDQLNAPPGFEPTVDIESIRVAEPQTGPLAGKLVLNFKVRGIPNGVLPSGTRWVLRFNITQANGSPRSPPAGQDDFFVGMTTESGPTRFVYGTTGVEPDPSLPAGARLFTISGDLDPASSFANDGTVQIVVADNTPLIGPFAPGDTLIKMFPTTRAPATPNNAAIYDQGEEFEYTLRAANACDVVVNLPPVAALSAVPTSGVAPLPVSFNGAGSSDPDAGDTIASYTLDFGDGTAPVTQAGASFNHTYAQPGNYVASLRVTDSRGLQSTSAAQVTVTVTNAQGATAPGAPTIGTATPGDREASITFTAPASDGGSPITSYTASCNPGNFSATGPGSPLVVGSLVNGTTYTCTVSATNAAGTGPASQPVQVTPRTVPGAPVIGAATPGDGQASLGFGAPSSNGGSPITGYTATCTPGNATGSSAASPIVVTGLQNGTTYSCTVSATNAAGTGPASAPVQVTPQGGTAPGDAMFANGFE